MIRNLLQLLRKRSILLGFLIILKLITLAFDDNESWSFLDCFDFGPSHQNLGKASKFKELMCYEDQIRWERLESYSNNYTAGLIEREDLTAENFFRIVLDPIQTGCKNLKSIGTV